MSWEGTKSPHHQKKNYLYKIAKTKVWQHMAMIKQTTMKIQLMRSQEFRRAICCKHYEFLVSKMLDPSPLASRSTSYQNLDMRMSIASAFTDKSFENCDSQTHFPKLSRLTCKVNVKCYNLKWGVVWQSRNLRVMCNDLQPDGD